MPTKPEITYRLDLEEEHVPVRGNALASGDDAADKAAEDEILQQMDRGNLAAWCTVIVTATFKVGTTHYHGKAVLGCCSYGSEEEAEVRLLEADEQGLKAEALADLRSELESLVKRGKAAAKALKAL